MNMLPSRHQKLDIDVILSNLIALKSLQLVNCTLEKKKQAEKPHGLAELDFRNWTVNLSAMDYFSNACPAIKHLQLNTT